MRTNVFMICMDHSFRLLFFVLSCMHRRLVYLIQYSYLGKSALYLLCHFHHTISRSFGSILFYALQIYLQLLQGISLYDIVHHYRLRSRFLHFTVIPRSATPADACVGDPFCKHDLDTGQVLEPSPISLGFLLPPRYHAFP